MITRRKLLSDAVESCLIEIYKWVIPKVTWKEFIKENKEYSKKYKIWEHFRGVSDKENLSKEDSKLLEKFSDWKEKTKLECIGPAPYEFYYLPSDVLKDIVDTYIHVYKINSQQELLDTISILKKYCEDPIIDKYIDDWTDKYGNHHPGYRSYDHSDNLKTELQKIFDDKILPDICKQYNEQYNLQTTGIKSSVSKAYSQIFQNKFFKFLDMAGDFYNWNSELNSFSTSVYLGPSPNSCKEKVIENWKKYRNQDIKINEEQIKKEYYGEED